MEQQCDAFNVFEKTMSDDSDNTFIVMSECIKHRRFNLLSGKGGNDNELNLVECSFRLSDKQTKFLLSSRSLRNV